MTVQDGLGDLFAKLYNYAASTPYWYDQPQAWDTFVVGGFTLPGIAKVDVERDIGADTKQVSGSSGFTVTWTGYKPAKVTVELTIATAQHLALIDMVMPILLPAPGKAGSTFQPFDCAHPKLKIQQVKSLALLKVEGPKDGRDGFKILTFRFQEYRVGDSLGTSVSNPQSQQQLPATTASGTAPSGGTYASFLPPSAAPDPGTDPSVTGPRP